jgi:TPR repeat protein
MMQITRNIICRFGASALLPACLLSAAMPVYADPGAPADLNSVRELAEKGSVRDEITLAADYFSGTGVAQDSKMAAYWYEKAAGHGNPQAQNQIGYFYQAGIGVPQDSKRAVHWYQLAASSGFATAKVNLAVAYLRGLGVRQDGEIAVRLLNQAFQAGNGTAATYLGHLYYFGIAVKQDKVVAEKWFESGLKLHDPLAAYDLGSFYSVHPDHSHDLPKAAELLRLASDAGYVSAMHSLGLLLVNHPELKQSPGQSRALLETAANAGSWKSSVVLGILARDGRGTPADIKTAYYHFSVSVLQGGAEADHFIRREMDTIAAKIGAEDAQKLTSAANMWYGHHSLVLAFVYKEGSVPHDFPTAALANASDGSFAGQLVPLSGS